VTTTFIDASGQSHPQISSDPVAVLRLGLRLELVTPLVNEVNRWLAGNSALGTVVEVGQQGRARSYLDFNNAAIAEFVVPGRHAASRADSSLALTASISASAPRPDDHAALMLLRESRSLSITFRLAIERLPTTWVRTIALVAFRRTTGGVVPSDRLVTLCDVVLTNGVGAGLIVDGPPADHGESTRVRPAAR